jgi:hypothetical protein
MEKIKCPVCCSGHIEVLAEYEDGYDFVNLEIFCTICDRNYWVTVSSDDYVSETNFTNEKEVN